MYGVLLDSIFEVMRGHFNADEWAEIQRLAGYNCDADVNEFQSYTETLIPRLTSSAHLVTGISPDQLMEVFGQHFVSYVARRLDDHEALLSVLGRHLRDFLNGLDNLHE